MHDSAKTRRSVTLRRVFLCSTVDRLDRPRRSLSRRSHLGCMNDLTRAVPGLEPVLTTSELAAHLGVPVQTIHDLRHSGRGPKGFRVGREMRYQLSEIRAWLARLEKADSGRLSDEAGEP